LHKVFKMKFADLYDCYIQKVERKSRTIEELNEVLNWFAGLDKKSLNQLLKSDTDLEEFFDQTTLNPNAELITGTICGVKIQEIEDPLMKKIRYLDKLVDELAKGRPLEKIKRS